MLRRDWSGHVIRVSANPLCNYAVSLWTDTERYVATRFILFSSTAESSATSGYVVAPERSCENEAWADRNVQRTRESLVLFTTVDLINAVCHHK